MMQSYIGHNIQELPLSSPYFRKRVERFLGENGLRLEAVDVYCAIQDEAGDILAGAGLSSDIIKCIAVAPEARCEGLVAPLVSHLISLASARGITELKLFTKPENQAIFESLGFHVLARAPKAILMEKGRGLERYCTYLKGFAREGRCGVVVMNANPFTLGHRYLLEQAAARVETLFVIPVKEDVSLFPYAERLAMIRAGTDRPVIVLEGSDYQISAATFPTYFLKDLSDAAETQMRLDLDLFARHIAPALNASVRFVGSEPFDPLTARYNELMKEVLPEVVEIPRLETISASAVRTALEEGSFAKAKALCPETTWPYLLAALAQRALREELDLPLKPGLVCPESCGAHKDMDYSTMFTGIRTLRPFWSEMALASSPEELRQLGIEAEQAMLQATGGVNTHRGAIFCLGLAVFTGAQTSETEQLIQSSLSQTAQRIIHNQLKDNTLPSSPAGRQDARSMAAGGYRALFEDWLPFYRNEASLQKLLLKIMSTLDDTCVIKRVGYERAQDVKKEARELLENFTQDKLKDLCDRYAQEGVSPGGAADMLALTIFIHSILS